MFLSEQETIHSPEPGRPEMLVTIMSARLRSVRPRSTTVPWLISANLAGTLENTARGVRARGGLQRAAAEPKESRGTAWYVRGQGRAGANKAIHIRYGDDLSLVRHDKIPRDGVEVGRVTGADLSNVARRAPRAIEPHEVVALLLDAVDEIGRGAHATGVEALVFEAT